jgi:murein DD-endopeptidase MepM/ murein hydrolase activator NlpD
MLEDKMESFDLDPEDAPPSHFFADMADAGENLFRRRIIWAVVRVVLACLVLYSAFLVGRFTIQSGENKETLRLQEENKMLRGKLELYSTTVDSIYVMLDSLELKTKTKPSKDYPYYSGGGSADTGWITDQSLRIQINILEEKLIAILDFLGADAPDLTISPMLDLPVSGNIPAIYPTFGRVSDVWGMRIHPFSGELEHHNGIDIANLAGTPIYATAEGVVVQTDFDEGYGKRIIIDHGNGYRTLYAHLYNHQVRQGDTVTKGQIIALMGSSGVSTGPHLHYEVQYNGVKQNPANYLNRLDEYAIR